MVLFVQSCAKCLGFKVSHEMFLEVLSTLQQWTSEDSISLLDRLPKCSIGHGLKMFQQVETIWNNINIQPYIWTQLLFVEPIFHMELFQL